MKIQKIIIPILGLLLVATILTGVKASDEGDKLVTLEKKSANLNQTNKELRDKIVSSSSLNEIEKNAQSLSMQKPEKFIYITNTGIAHR